MMADQRRTSALKHLTGCLGPPVFGLDITLIGWFWDESVVDDLWF